MLTVITPADSRELTSLETVKLELGLTGVDDDAYIGGLIDQASAAVETWCGRPFALEEVCETLDLTARSSVLLLSRWPVTSIASITASGISLDPSAFEFDGNSGQVFRITETGTRCAWGIGRTVVKYSTGYVLPGEEGRTLPHDIEWAVLSLIRAAFLGRARDPMIRSETIDGIGALTYFGRDAIEGVVPMLAAHRMPNIG